MNRIDYTRAFAALLFLCHFNLSGQITFQKSYGAPNIQSEAQDIVETSDGYLAAGFTVNNSTGRDGLLMRLDLQGNVIWEKTYNIGSYDEFTSVVNANDDGFVVLGLTRPDGQPNDVWLLKVAPNGDIVWQRQFNMPNGGMSGFKIQVVPGGYVISGAVSSNGGTSTTYVIRVANNGDLVWSKRYQVPNSLMTVGYVTDSLLYAGGISTFTAAFMALDPATGNIVKAKTYEAPGSESLDYIAPTADGNLLLADYAQPFWPNNKLYNWLQKVTPEGNVIWSKVYDFGLPFQFSGPVISASDGGFLVCPGEGSNNPQLDAQMMKLDADGHVSWCYSYGKPNGNEWFRQAIQTSDGGFIAAGMTANGGQPPTSVFIVKTDAKGRIAGCCPRIKSVTELNFPTTVQSPVYTAVPFVAPFETFGETTARTSPAETFACTTPQPTLQIELALCPGETVTLGGQTYTQPDTVTLELPGATCDTLATYILTDASATQNSLVSLQCPVNIVKTVPAGTNSTPISYTIPTASTDCTCPGIELTKTAGGDSGSNFPLGNNNVCWKAEDACGSTKTCCFTVSIAEESSACDTKTTACLTWELLSVKRDAGNQQYYTIRITNTCAASLSYAYIGLPSGITANSPGNNSVYTAPSGRQYEVRNPNFSPVYGIRFKPQTNSLQSGQSDIFQFSLPPQTSPNYFYVAGRLSNSSFYEAHLNTFSCPVGVENNAANRDLEQAAPLVEITLSPNPATAGSNLYLHGKPIPAGELYLTSVSGQTMLRARILDNQVMLDNTVLPEGLYFFKVLENGNCVGVGKVVFRG